MALNQAVSALGVTGSIGVNTHIDFNNFGYQNIAGTIAAIKYVFADGKVKPRLRDCPGNDNDINTWGAISAATGAKWLAFIGETSLNGAASQLNRMPAMAAAGLLEMIEGPNEWDDAYPKSQGVNLPMAVTFQSTQVLPLGRSLGLPVVNISFGAGWFAPLYEGDYVTVGDMSPFADYANPHTYPLPGQNTEGAIIRLDDLAHRAAPGRPIIMTELGWPDSQYPNERDEARFLLFGMFDAINLGIVRSYFYALYNDGAGKFGLMNTDGTPQMSGAALHNVMSILADTAAGTPGTLDYAITGVGVNDRSLLAQKSTGEFELVLWNERDVGHSVTVTLPAAAAAINLYDPLVGASPISTQANASSVTVSISDHPVIVEIIPAPPVVILPPPPPPPPPPPVQTPLSVSLVPASVSLDDQTAIGTGVSVATVLASDGLAFAGTLAVDAPFAIAAGHITLASALPAGPATLNPVVTASENGVAVTAPLAVTVTHALPPPPPPPPTLTWNPQWVTPASLAAHVGIPLGSLGISVTDPEAVGHAGSMALNVSVTRGTLSAKDSAGTFLPGSGTAKLATYKAGFAQTNAVLATLTYTASAAGSDAMSLDIWDQGGHEAKKSLPITIS